MKEVVGLGAVLCQVEPREGLYANVLARIAAARRRSARRLLAIQSCLCFLFGFLLVPLAQYAGQEFFNSGFYEYASMLAEDRTAALALWRELALSLIESIPSVVLLLMLACIAAFIWSMRSAIRNGRTAFGAVAQF